MIVLQLYPGSIVHNQSKFLFLCRPTLLHRFLELCADLVRISLFTRDNVVNLAGFEEMAPLAWRHPRPKVLNIPLLSAPGSRDDSHLPGFPCFLNSRPVS